MSGQISNARSSHWVPDLESLLLAPNSSIALFAPSYYKVIFFLSGLRRDWWYFSFLYIRLQWIFGGASSVRLFLATSQSRSLWLPVEHPSVPVRVAVLPMWVSDCFQNSLWVILWRRLVLLRIHLLPPFLSFNPILQLPQVLILWLVYSRVRTAIMQFSPWVWQPEWKLITVWQMV